MLALSLIAPAAALEVTLADPGTLSGEWSQDIVAGGSDSARAFLAFIAHGMIEQSFTLQHAPLVGSAGMPGPDGLAIGVELDTFPFRAAPTNGQGKVENTKFVPAVPRFTASWVRGGRLSWGAGASLVPPVSVNGASALLVGADASIAYGALDWLTVGLEADVTAGQAYAPVVATPEAREAGVLENVDEARYEAVCVPQAYGCVDSLLVRHGGLHAVVIFPISTPVQPWVRFGGRLLDDRFIVQVDLSDWRVAGLLPDVGAGVNLALHDHFRLGLGGSLAPLPEAATQGSDSPIVYRFSAQVAWAPGTPGTKKPKAPQTRPARGVK